MPVNMMMGKQTVRGTAVTPTYSVPILNDVIPTEKAEPITSKRRNQNNLTNIPQKGSINVEFPTEHELDPISCLPLFASMFPKYSFSGPGAVKTHTFKPADDSTEYASIHTSGWTEEFYNAITGNSYTVLGASAKSLNIAMPKNSVIPLSLAWMARSVTEGASGETFTAPDGALLFNNYEASLSAGSIGSEVAIPIYDLTIKADMALEYKHVRGAGASRYSAKVKLALNGLSISGTFKMSREDSERAAVKSAHDNFTEQSLIITYTSPENIPGSATPYSVSFAFQEVVYTLLERAEENNEDMETYTYAVGFGNDSDNVIITVVNGEADMGL